MLEQEYRSLQRLMEIAELRQKGHSGHASAGLELSGSRGYALCADGEALCE